MGRVWRATDVVLHREVAIKELVPPPGLTPEERREMRERSLREARAIARLNNINVVRVFDVLQTDADPWIVMEYVPSRSLQDTLAADGPFNAVRVAEIGLGVLGALRAAHRAGVVHRDVKPGNVLLGADGRVVLTDFGLATVPGDPNVTRTGLVLGSPAYIAPERARERPRYSYIPFGVGPHVCPGAALSMNEILATVAVLVQRLRIRLVPDQDIAPVAWTTLRPRNGLMVTIEPR